MYLALLLAGIVGAVGYGLFCLTLCKAAGNSDTRMGWK
jgi:hypothetical protein